MPRAFRAMIQAQDGLPLVKDNSLGLGLRPRDLNPDDDGMVQPGRGGPSVISSIAGFALRVEKHGFPFTMVPERLSDRIAGAAGKADIKVFCIGDGAFEHGLISDAVQLVPDRNEHGTLQPAHEMSFEEFRTRILDTREDWRDGEHLP